MLIVSIRPSLECCRRVGAGGRYRTSLPVPMWRRHGLEGGLWRSSVGNLGVVEVGESLHQRLYCSRLERRLRIILLGCWIRAETTWWFTAANGSALNRNDRQGQLNWTFVESTSRQECARLASRLIGLGRTERAQTMRLKLAAMSMVASVALTAAARAEVIVVPFTDPSPTVTTSSYSGEVTVNVGGVGQSAGTELNDAFYTYTDANGAPATPDDRGFYDLGFGTGGSAKSIDNYVSPTPAYDPNHVYTFELDTGLSKPAPLDFQLIDNGYLDNSGSFTVSVSQVSAALEPSTWALLFGGLSIVGLMLRRTRKNVSHQALTYRA